LGSSNSSSWYKNWHHAPAIIFFCHKPYGFFLKKNRLLVWKRRWTHF
jgi:hypothetical protein